ncbi:MAG: glutamate--tRNA ligase [Acidimicrobiales bacterium]
MTAQAGGGRPRVRFAPSPTGFLHVGSARAALFNWLYARQNGGTFILRIEDTDAERNREEWVDGILTSLAWLDMAPDEGPFRQSEHTAATTAAVDVLWAAGAVYACDCDRETVEARTKGNATPGYDGFCRDRGLARDAGALRFRTPRHGEVVVHDLIRGDVVFQCTAIEDFVVVKSTGAPLFVLANVVDDIDMGISHVIRGEDLLPSTPKGLLLWSALQGPGAKLPVFAHLPLLVNAKRQKLSKRRDTVAVESYRAEGYLADAMRNYLALLGWSPPDGTEILSAAALIEQFRLEDVNNSPAFFDVEKLRWMNGEYIRALSVDAFVTAARPWTSAPVAPWPPERFDEDVFRRLAPLVQERVTVLGEVTAMVDFLFLAAPAIDEATWAGLERDDSAPDILDGALAAYADCAWTAAALHEVTLAVADKAGKKPGKAQAPIRIAVTGRKVGPPLFESMEVLGRSAVLERIGAVADRLRRRAG